MEKWSEGLPQDLLGRIFNLCSLRDSIRMRSVCKSWLLVSNWNISRRPQLPWLMMPFNPNCKSAEEEGPEGRCFFSLSDNTIYTIKVPEIRGRLCCASFNNGWLMTIDPNLLDIQLFHPWRFHPSHRIQLQLPHLSNYSSCRVTRLTPPIQSKTLQICRAAMSDDAAVVAIIDVISFQFAFCRTGKDGVWNRVDRLYRAFNDIIFHKGWFYCIGLSSDNVVAIYINNDNTAYTQTIRVTRGVICRQGLGDFHHVTYLVADSASESLFIVKRSIRWYYAQSEAVLPSVPRTFGFAVYKIGLEESTGKYKKNPVRVESLGDRVMFLGMNSSILVMAGQFPGLKGNCIYFTDNYFSQYTFDSLPIGWADNGVFNMVDGTISPLVPDRAHPPFSPPIWITPLL